MKPADIDPSSSVPYEDQDSVMELKVQEKINTFFSEVIVPSPLNQPAIVQPLISDVASPVNSERQTSDGKKICVYITLLFFVIHKICIFYCLFVLVNSKSTFDMS